jgi:hypothetical protein
MCVGVSMIAHVTLGVAPTHRLSLGDFHGAQSYAARNLHHLNSILPCLFESNRDIDKIRLPMVQV